MLGKSTGLFVLRYINIETGTGKGMIDGNFAMMMKIVRAYVDMGFNICTPSQLVYTLNSNGGEYNCISEVIKHDHIHLNALISEHDSYIKRLKKLSGHTNELEFARDHKSMKLWSYSRP